MTDHAGWWASAAALLAILAACAPSAEDDDDDSGRADDDSAAADDDSAGDDDTTSVGDDDTVELPPSPLPISIDLSGAATETAYFDSIECAHPPNNQLQLTYVDSTNAYTWTLRVFVRDPFEGEGAYSGNVQVQLLENFSGGRYFSASSTAGQAVEVVVDGFGSNGAFGSFTTDPVEDGSGAVTLSPQPIPIWCDQVYSS